MATRNLYAAIRNLNIANPRNHNDLIASWDADSGAFIAELWKPTALADDGQVFEYFYDSGNATAEEEIKLGQDGNLYFISGTRAHLEAAVPVAGKSILNIIEPDGTPVAAVDLAVGIAVNSYYLAALFIAALDEIWIIVYNRSNNTRHLCMFDSTGALITDQVLGGTTQLPAINGLVIIDDIAYWSDNFNEGVIHRYDIIGSAPLSDVTITGSEDSLFRLAIVVGGLVYTTGLYNDIPTVKRILCTFNLDGSGLVKYSTLNGDNLVDGGQIKGYCYWYAETTDAGEQTWQLYKVNITPALIKTIDPAITYPNARAVANYQQFIIDGPDVPQVTDLSVDCTNKNIVIDGVGFPDVPTITLTFNGEAMEFDVILVSPTQIIVHPDTFANGTWCALVS